METLIDQIRASLADDATDDAHQTGVAACRTILAALEARRPSARSVGDLPALVALRTTPRMQLLDHVIAKLRTMQPEPQSSSLAIAPLIGALRGMSLDQILELGLTKLQAAMASPRSAGLPAGTRVIKLPPTVRSPR